jgi:hypothetical protein
MKRSVAVLTGALVVSALALNDAEVERWPSLPNSGERDPKALKRAALQGIFG